MIVYKITCLVNGKVYVGQTSEPIERRFKRHMGYQKYEHDTKFYRAVLKYGVENFTIEQIDTAESQNELDEKEVYWINYYDSVNKGYNTRSDRGKCGGDTLTNNPNLDEIRKKLSVSKLGDNNPMRILGGLKGSKNGMFGKRGKEVPSSRPCVAVSVSGDDVKYFDCMTDLKNYFQVTTLGMISLRCSGKTKSPYKGYYFKYKDDYEKGLTTIESIAM